MSSAEDEDSSLLSAEDELSSAEEELSAAEEEDSPLSPRGVEDDEDCHASLAMTDDEEEDSTLPSAEDELSSVEEELSAAEEENSPLSPRGVEDD